MTDTPRVMPPAPPPNTLPPINLQRSSSQSRMNSRRSHQRSSSQTRIPPKCIICNCNPRTPGSDHNGWFKCCNKSFCNSTGYNKCFRWCNRCKHRKIQSIIHHESLRCDSCNNLRKL
jgi:hypothetical protein